tara:strand:+ start:3248 stop:8989 length:5742 start_codon:yes stop_codon:yes gene_type:complete
MTGGANVALNPEIPKAILASSSKEPVTKDDQSQNPRKDLIAYLYQDKTVKDNDVKTFNYRICNYLNGGASEKDKIDAQIYMLKVFNRHLNDPKKKGTEGKIEKRVGGPKAIKRAKWCYQKLKFQLLLLNFKIERLTVMNLNQMGSDKIVDLKNQQKTISALLSLYKDGSIFCMENVDFMGNTVTIKVKTAEDKTKVIKIDDVGNEQAMKTEYKDLFVRTNPSDGPSKAELESGAETLYFTTTAAATTIQAMYRRIETMSREEIASKKQRRAAISIQKTYIRAKAKKRLKILSKKVLELNSTLEEVSGQLIKINKKVSEAEVNKQVSKAKKQVEEALDSVVKAEKQVAELAKKVAAEEEKVRSEIEVAIQAAEQATEQAEEAVKKVQEIKAKVVRATTAIQSRVRVRKANQQVATLRATTTIQSRVRVKKAKQQVIEAIIKDMDKHTGVILGKVGRFTEEEGEEIKKLARIKKETIAKMMSAKTIREMVKIREQYEVELTELYTSFEEQMKQNWMEYLQQRITTALNESNIEGLNICLNLANEKESRIGGSLNIINKGIESLVAKTDDQEKLETLLSNMKTLKTGLWDAQFDITQADNKKKNIIKIIDERLRELKATSDERLRELKATSRDPEIQNWSYIERITYLEKSKENYTDKTKEEKSRHFQRYLEKCVENGKCITPEAAQILHAFTDKASLLKNEIPTKNVRDIQTCLFYKAYYNKRFKALITQQKEITPQKERGESVSKKDKHFTQLMTLLSKNQQQELVYCILEGEDELKALRKCKSNDFLKKRKKNLKDELSEVRYGIKEEGHSLQDALTFVTKVGFDTNKKISKRKTRIINLMGDGIRNACKQNHPDLVNYIGDQKKEDELVKAVQNKIRKDLILIESCFRKTGEENIRKYFELFPIEMEENFLNEMDTATHPVVLSENPVERSLEILKKLRKLAETPLQDAEKEIEKKEEKLKVKTELKKLRNIEKMEKLDEFQLPKETIGHPADILTAGIKEDVILKKMKGELDKQIQENNIYPDLSKEDLESIIDLFTKDFDGSGQVCMNVLGMLFSQEEDQKKFLSHYVYPRLVIKIYNDNKENPNIVSRIRSCAGQDSIAKMLEDKDGIANVIRLIGHSYQGFDRSSEGINEQDEAEFKSTLLSDTQITAVRKIYEAATEEKKVVIKLGAGEGKTWLSKIAAKICPDAFNQPIIHIAPFDQYEPGKGVENLAVTELKKYIGKITRKEIEEFKQCIKEVIDSKEEVTVKSIKKNIRKLLKKLGVTEQNLNKLVIAVMGFLEWEEMTKLDNLQPGRHYWVRSDKLETMLKRKTKAGVKCIQKALVFCDEYDQILRLIDDLKELGIKKQCHMSATDDLKTLVDAFQDAASRVSSFGIHLGVLKIEAGKQSEEDLGNIVRTLGEEIQKLSKQEGEFNRKKFEKLKKLKDKLPDYMSRNVDQMEPEFKRNMKFNKLEMTEEPKAVLSQMIEKSKEKLENLEKKGQEVIKLQYILPNAEILQKNRDDSKIPKLSIKDIQEQLGEISSKPIYVHMQGKEGMKYPDGNNVKKGDQITMVKEGGTWTIQKFNDSEVEGIHVTLYDCRNKVGGDFGFASRGVDYQGIHVDFPDTEPLTLSLLYQMARRNREGEKSRNDDCEISIFSTKELAKKPEEFDPSQYLSDIEGRNEEISRKQILKKDKDKLKEHVEKYIELYKEIYKDQDEKLQEAIHKKIEVEVEKCKNGKGQKAVQESITKEINNKKEELIKERNKEKMKEELRIYFNDNFIDKKLKFGDNGEVEKKVLMDEFITEKYKKELQKQLKQNKFDFTEFDNDALKYNLRVGPDTQGYFNTNYFSKNIKNKITKVSINLCDILRALETKEEIISNEARNQGSESQVIELTKDQVSDLEYRHNRLIYYANKKEYELDEVKGGLGQLGG